jgi:hypothetical protein
MAGEIKGQSPTVRLNVLSRHKGPARSGVDQRLGAALGMATLGTCRLTAGDESLIIGVETLDVSEHLQEPVLGVAVHPGRERRAEHVLLVLVEQVVPVGNGLVGDAATELLETQVVDARERIGHLLRAAALGRLQDLDDPQLEHRLLLVGESLESLGGDRDQLAGHGVAVGERCRVTLDGHDVGHF